MRYSLLLLAAGTALTLAPAAQAAPVGAPEGLRAALDSVAMTEKTQFIFGGRQYCFYPDGWHGAGWYRCGFQLRRGFGWGGPMGWQGWSYERGPRMGRHERFERREGRSERREGRGEIRGGARFGAQGNVSGTTGQGGQSGPANNANSSGQNGPIPQGNVQGGGQIGGQGSGQVR